MCCRCCQRAFPNTHALISDTCRAISNENVDKILKLVAGILSIIILPTAIIFDIACNFSHCCCTNIILDEYPWNN